MAPKVKQRKAQPIASTLFSTTIKQIIKKIGMDMNDPSKIYDIIFAILFKNLPAL